jgi:hypothetical protein
LIIKTKVFGFEPKTEGHIGWLILTNDSVEIQFNQRLIPPIKLKTVGSPEIFLAHRRMRVWLNQKPVKPVFLPLVSAF